jgi:hypothetical protein
MIGSRRQSLPFPERRKEVRLQAIMILDTHVPYLKDRLFALTSNFAASKIGFSSSFIDVTKKMAAKIRRRSPDTDARCQVRGSSRFERYAHAAWRVSRWSATSPARSSSGPTYPPASTNAMGTARIRHHENTASSRSLRTCCVMPCIPPIEQPPNGSIPALYRQMCVIRRKAASDSDVIRPPIPTEVGHPFRLKPATLVSAA